jgi:SpoVK/Ycf46/Vps4 family AAA+-type ATPase
MEGTIVAEAKKLILSCISKNVQNTADYSFLETAILNATRMYLEKSKEPELFLQISYGTKRPSVDVPEIQEKPNAREREDDALQQRVKQYCAQEPIYSFERLIINDDVMDELKHAINLFKHHDLIYNVWGLKANTPFPVVALNFFGPSGTGKTLAAHAMASFLKKRIIIASYAQIESMYHGEGPKNVEAIFKAAETQDAILFVDEADSLLSRRLTDVRQGSENAINSMRSQILICLEKFKGIVIFATNLVTNYDRAFESRVRSIEFKLPDEKCRRKMWALHLPTSFPQDETVVYEELAKIDDICGREIRNAVQNVAERMADKGISCAKLDMLQDAVEKIKTTRFKQNPLKEKVIPLSDTEQKELTDVVNDMKKKKGSEGHDKGTSVSLA